MVKILVIGGAGFIGSHLCEELIKNKDNEIFVLDNYSTGSEKNHIEGVKYIKGNTMDINSLVDFTPDVVYHLGEYSRTSESFKEPRKVWEYNIKGTFEVLEFCREKKVGKLAYAGSSTKLADGGDGRNQSPYAWTKAANTELIQRYGEWFDLPYVIVYFYNVFGGREIKEGNYATLIGIFKRLREENKPLTLVSPGNQMRSFTHVEDIVRGIILGAEKGNGDGYCLGPKEMHSIKDVAEMFEGKIEWIPERPGDRKSVAIDLTKTEEELGWEAKIKLEDYIKDFLKKL